MSILAPIPYLIVAGMKDEAFDNCNDITILNPKDTQKQNIS